jgi:hypothetical protein
MEEETLFLVTEPLFENPNMLFIAPYLLQIVHNRIKEVIVTPDANRVPNQYGDLSLIFSDMALRVEDESLSNPTS